MTRPRFSGSMVAIVTPFGAEGRFDRAAFDRLIAWHLSAGTDAIVVCGTTGEAATLSDAEYDEVVGSCVRAVGSRVPVIAGTGSNSTAGSLTTTRRAAELGADAALVVSPYYNKPTQGGLLRHYETILDGVDLPLILYNVPGRTACNLAASTTLALASHPRCVGIKEASGDLVQVQHILHGAPDNFAVLSGDDALTFAVMAHGGHGAIGVAANVAPRACKLLVQALADRDLPKARSLQRVLLPLMESLFLESNPIPVKAALAHMGRIDEYYRLPLVPAQSSTRARLAVAIDGVQSALCNPDQ